MQTVSHSKFISLDARIDSFVNWPINKEPKKETLAGTGYFYDHKNTILRYFYCDGVSWDLKPDDGQDIQSGILTVHTYMLLNLKNL